MHTPTGICSSTADRRARSAFQADGLIRQRLVLDPQILLQDQQLIILGLQFLLLALQVLMNFTERRPGPLEFGDIVRLTTQPRVLPFSVLKGPALSRK